MKALSVKPQWAALIASGAKTLELRSRPIKHRGDLLICATKPDGVAVCIVKVVGCRPFVEADEAASASIYRPGLWAWELADVRLVQRVPIRGMLGLFTVPDELIQSVPQTAAVSSSDALRGL